MQNLLNFLWKNYAFFLFLILEFIALSMVVSNGHQSAVFSYTSNQMGGEAFSSWQSIVHYFDLGEANEQLVEENKRLRSQLDQSFLDRDFIAFDTISVNDSLIKWDSTQNKFLPQDTNILAFEYIGAKTISNSIHKQKNYLMLNKGLAQGVRENMGVIGPNGVVGIVYSASEDFSTVVSLLNIKTRISSKLKTNNELGILQWDGQNPNLAQFNSIETYIPIKVGDSIITSGYSHIFPEGIMLGVIQDYHRNTSDNTYYISVKLSTKFSSLKHVTIIRNRFYEEQILLEKTLEDER
ncbi:MULTISPECIES: rod shape-determining protein MreC [unclassified Lentimicrobium]|uniref:rod shape-determining protein MreC n=1 Tax=unclassified Lentimicrobium TaxID=2677434 RepID=UPI001551F95F|nr:MULTISPECIES: rod shape-determining protein MreC [unclassified Lentimicrobium]NPD44830.1 rod shape-determining protein MreC [Lentimicrobium sp. S6]NPD83153.1 rod shape-determining protein MreC [Lentimicrobium sp. L6]